MTIQDIGSIGEFVGSMLILVTLVSLALQNRYQQKLLLSQAFQARTDTMVGQVMSAVQNPQWAGVQIKAHSGDELSAIEHQQRIMYMMAGLKSFENIFCQTELGVVPVGQAQSVRRVLKGIVIRKQHNHLIHESVFEPSTLLPLGAGIAGLVYRCRRVS